jgi:hypothetical protein
VKIIRCTKCGGNELIDETKHVICAYCRAIFVRDEGLANKKKSTISVSSDVANLLKRCREEPDNRKRLAGLVLDIDPTNEEARRYLS